MKYLLINLDAKEICGASDNIKELEAIGEKNTWAYHIAKDETFEGCTAHDLAQFYNRLPGTVTKVDRFKDRATGIRRVNESIEKGGLCEIRTGKKAVKARKQKAEGNKTGRVTWATASITAKGSTEGVRFHKENPRFKIFALIKEREEIGRDELLKLCEDKLSVKRSQALGAISKLFRRGLITVK